MQFERKTPLALQFFSLNAQPFAAFFVYLVGVDLSFHSQQGPE